MEKNNQPRQRFTQDEIDRCSEVNLVELAKTKGYELVRSGQDHYKIPGHGGLTLSANGEGFYNHSLEKGGKAIQFLMQVENKTWYAAVKELTGGFNESPQPYRSAAPVAEKPRAAFALPPKGPHMRNVFAYLSQTRAIDNAVISDFAHQGLLYQNEKRSCVFVGSNQDGTAEYAMQRSTYDSRTNPDGTNIHAFKGEVSGSDKSRGFAYRGGGDTVHVFESPIDMMSYMSCLQASGADYKQSNYLALGGVCSKALDRYLLENPDTQKLVLLMDNDEAGNRAKMSFEEKYSEAGLRVEIPTYGAKDWNEKLLADTRQRLADQKVELAKEVLQERTEQEAALSANGKTDDLGESVRLPQPEAQTMAELQR